MRNIPDVGIFYSRVVAGLIGMVIMGLDYSFWELFFIFPALPQNGRNFSMERVESPSLECPREVSLPWQRNGMR